MEPETTTSRLPRDRIEVVAAEYLALHRNLLRRFRAANAVGN